MTSTKPRMMGFLECLASDGSSFELPDLFCPHGHPIPWRTAFHEAGYPRCDHRAKGSGRADCNARLFVQFFPRINPRALPIIFVAEISYEEIMHVTKAGFDVPAIMSYLGFSWNPRGTSMEKAG